MKGVNLANDKNLKGVSAPVLRKNVQSGTTFTTEEAITVIVGADVTITIGGIGIDILQGSMFVLIPNITYTFSSDVVLGVS